jgi:hypothetical protein
MLALRFSFTIGSRALSGVDWRCLWLRYTHVLWRQFVLIGLTLGVAFGLMLGATSYAQVLNAVSGAVELSTAGSSYRPAFEGESLPLDGRVRTLANGAVWLELNDESYIRLDGDTTLLRRASGYVLEAGSIYASASNLVIYVDIPTLRLDGEARFDVTDEVRRVAVFAGRVIASPQGSAVVLTPGQQFFRGADMDTAEVSAYLERDPWYLNIVPVASESALVNAFAGRSELLLPGEDTWQAASLQAPFEVGMSARTGADSWLEVTFDNANVVRLQADSQATFTSFDDLEDGTRRTVIDLSRGTLWSVVEGQQQRFDIETIGLVAGVRGTTFRVDAAGVGASAIKVFEGTVLGVVNGAGTEVAADEQFDPVAGVVPLEPDDLDAFNLARDVLLEQTPEPRLQLNPDVRTVVLVDTDNLLLQGRAINTDTLRVAGDVVSLADDGSFSVTLTPADGSSTVTFELTNAARSTVNTITIIRQAQ